MHTFPEVEFQGEQFERIPIHPLLGEVFRLNAQPSILRRLDYGLTETGLLARWLNGGAEMFEPKLIEGKSKVVLKPREGAIQIEGISHQNQHLYCATGHLLPGLASHHRFPDDNQLELIVVEGTFDNMAAQLRAAASEAYRRLHNLDHIRKLVDLSQTGGYITFGVHSGISDALNYEI